MFGCKDAKMFFDVLGCFGMFLDVFGCFWMYGCLDVWMFICHLCVYVMYMCLSMCVVLCVVLFCQDPTDGELREAVGKTPSGADVQTVQ